MPKLMPPQMLGTHTQGNNYAILKRTSKFGSHASSFLIKSETIGSQQTAASNPIAIQQKYSDSMQAKMSSLSEFASWNHLENNCPYW